MWCRNVNDNNEEKVNDELKEKWVIDFTCLFIFVQRMNGSMKLRKRQDQVQ